MSNVIMVDVVGRKVIRIPLVRGVIITDSTDISTKKIKKTSMHKNPFISVFSGLERPGIADIAVKKKIKHLTFIFGCAKRMW
jgi:hypothetical protein